MPLTTLSTGSTNMASTPATNASLMSSFPPAEHPAHCSRDSGRMGGTKASPQPANGLGAFAFSPFVVVPSVLDATSFELSLLPFLRPKRLNFFHGIVASEIICIHIEAAADVTARRLHVSSSRELKRTLGSIGCQFGLVGSAGRRHHKSQALSS